MLPHIDWMAQYRCDRRTHFELAYDGTAPPLDWRDGLKFEEALPFGLVERSEHAVLQTELCTAQRAASRYWPSRRYGADKAFRRLRCRLVQLWESIHQSDSQSRFGEC